MLKSATNKRVNALRLTHVGKTLIARATECAPIQCALIDVALMLIVRALGSARPMVAARRAVSAKRTVIVMRVASVTAVSATSRVPRVRAPETKCVVAMVDALSLLFVNRMRIASDNVFVSLAIAVRPVWEILPVQEHERVLRTVGVLKGQRVPLMPTATPVEFVAMLVYAKMDAATRDPVRAPRCAMETPVGAPRDQRVIRMMTVSMIDTVPARNAETPVSGTMIAREPVNVAVMDAAQNLKSVRDVMIVMPVESVSVTGVAMPVRHGPVMKALSVMPIQANAKSLSNVKPTSNVLAIEFAWEINAVSPVVTTRSA